MYTYGRSQLRRDTSVYQVFLILEYINGQPLTRDMRRNASEDYRRQFIGQIVDMFAQLRRLEFAQEGSLMPNACDSVWMRLLKFIFPREDSFKPQTALNVESRPKIGGAFSLRKGELQVDGYAAPRFVATNASEFFQEQHRLLQYMWKIPIRELDREQAEKEAFALHTLSLENAQGTLQLGNDAS